MEPHEYRTYASAYAFDDTIQFRIDEAFKNFFAATAGLSTEELMTKLNDAWETLGDDYELGDEEDYALDDPISFDELMGCDGWK